MSSKTDTVPVARPLFDPAIAKVAAVDAFKKLDPRQMIRQPVMFVVEIGSAFTLVLALHAAATGAGEMSAGFIFAISGWLWFTVLFANFATAMAEGRGKAQADSLRKARQDVIAKRLAEPSRAARRSRSPSPPRASARVTSSSSRPAISSLVTVTSSTAWRPSTRAPSPARARRSFARVAATGAA